MSYQRKKWWEFTVTEDESKVFKLLARNPNYKWRSINSILKKLSWTPEKLESVIQPYLNNKMILLLRNDNAMFLGYWEIVDVKGKLAEQE